MSNYQDLLNSALQLYQTGQIREAIVLYRQLLRNHPANAQLLYLLGTANFQIGYTDLAVEQLKRSLVLDEANPFAHYNLGMVYQALRNFGEAIVSYDKALALNPDFIDAHNNRGNALKDLGRYEESLLSYEKALALKPDYFLVYSNRGNVLIELDRLEEALEDFTRALSLNPRFVDAYSNRANVFLKLERLIEALNDSETAIALNPSHAEAYNNRGNAFSDLNRLDEALASYDKALALKPDYAEAYNNRGNALSDLNRLDEALASYDKALELKPDYAKAYNNRGNALSDLNRLDEALASFDKALALKPDYEFLAGKRLNFRMKLCQWTDFPEEIEALVKGVHEGKPVIQPFELSGLLDSPELLFKASQGYADVKFKKQAALGPILKPAPDGKICIGYYSADFRNHAVSYLMAELFELHDKSRFEILGFSFGPNVNDEMSQRLSESFDRFIDVRKMSDKEVSKLSRELGVDVAVDLTGYTKYSRPGIFAERAAPVQVSYLGYIGSMGVDYIDYIIADKIVVPIEQQLNYSEKIVYLPHSYQVNDSKRKISDRQFTKKEFGLPEKGFIFCSFNSNFKILPATFDGWMRILKVVDSSVLWLFVDNPIAAANLRLEAENRGVDSKRLVFARKMPLEDHLARYCLADLMLDTLPYNAGTTASDALWAGLPVLTCMGKLFVGRMAASLLGAIDLPELITTSQEEYEAKAIELASQPNKLRDIKDKIGRNRQTTPLFDTELFTRHIEAAYEEMYLRYLGELPPDVIEIT
jgi:predicted O-linked N-acetylglucosamine transferase (SPINDLY family)